MNNINRLSIEQNDFSISSHFKNIENPRKYNVCHNLIDIITISICALICGAQNWVLASTSLRMNYSELFPMIQKSMPQENSTPRLLAENSLKRIPPL